VKYFDDIAIGDVVMTGRHAFTAEDIKSYAARFDPQRFHIDEAEAARSPYGALIASGWHTAVAWMRLLIDHRRAEEEAMRARGETIPSIGPALGLRDLKWLKPVYVGDVIDYTTVVTEMRGSKSKPRFGLVTLLTTGINQSGAAVIEFASTTFVERRPEVP
jgi:acyl dehydratase